MSADSGFAQAISDLVAAHAAETEKLQRRVAGLEEALQRSKERLARQHAAYKAKLDAIWASHTGGVSSVSGAGAPSGRRRRRGLDAELLRVIQEAFPRGDFSIPELLDVWQARTQDSDLRGSTARGIVQRLVAAGRIVEVAQGGRGKGRITTYRLAATPQEVGDAAALTH